MKQQGLTLLVVLATVGSASASGVPTSFVHSDVVKNVGECDKYQWCKLTDGSGYIKGHLFKRYPKDPSIAIKHSDGITYLYKIRPIYKDDTPLFEFIEAKAPNDEVLYAKDNFKYGYVREKDKALYDEYMLQKANAQTKPIAQTKLDTTSEVVTEQKPENTNVSSATTSKAKYFIYGGIGTTSATIEKSSNIIATTEIKDSYTLLEAGLGYRYNPNYFATASVQRDTNSQTELTHFLASVNYQFADTLFKPYVGLVGGYGELVWKKPPIETSDKDTKASEYLLGVQAGIEYPLQDNFSLYGLYQYIPTGYTTEIGDDATMEHKEFNTIQIGVKYDIQ
jgi:hypothetical protein